ncbi:zinc finger protein, partial [Clarias magur]
MEWHLVRPRSPSPRMEQEGVAGDRVTPVVKTPATTASSALRLAWGLRPLTRTLLDRYADDLRLLAHSGSAAVALRR